MKLNEYTFIFRKILFVSGLRNDYVSKWKYLKIASEVHDKYVLNVNVVSTNLTAYPSEMYKCIKLAIDLRNI